MVEGKGEAGWLERDAEKGTEEAVKEEELSGKRKEWEAVMREEPGIQGKGVKR